VIYKFWVLIPIKTIECQYVYKLPKKPHPMKLGGKTSEIGKTEKKNDKITNVLCVSVLAATIVAYVLLVLL